MSDCSSISSCSLDSSCAEELHLNSNISYLFSPIKSSTSNHQVQTPSSRCRPGLHRSDHTAASVKQLDLNDSIHSYNSFSSPSTTSHFQSLSRKESLRHGSFKNDPCKYLSLNISLHLSDEPKRCLEKTRTVQFAPPSESLIIPIPSRSELSKEEIEGTWITKKEYEEQRTSNRKIIINIEKELSQPSEIGDDTSKAILMSMVVKDIEGARGLEHRTKYGKQVINLHRQQSIQAVLQEQAKRLRERNEITLKQFEKQLANVYSFEVAAAVALACDRGMNDAKEADIVETGSPSYSPKRRFKPINPTCIDRRFASSTVKDSAPSNVARTNSNELGESLHTLSSSSKRKGTRGLPSRQPSMALTNARTRVSNRNITYLPPAATRELMPQKVSSLRLCNSNNGQLREQQLHNSKASSLRISNKVVKNSICSDGQGSYTPARHKIVI